MKKKKKDNTVTVMTQKKNYSSQVLDCDNLNIFNAWNKGNNKITELRTILQRVSQNL
jgi:hypothetical protein